MLCRQGKKFKESGPENYSYETNYAHWKVFTHSEECLLLEYVQKASQLHFGLTTKKLKVCLNRATSFNRENVKNFFNIYTDILQ